MKEAKKLRQNEFVKWFKLTSEINPLLRRFRNDKIKTPSLYIMGEQDHLFLPSIKNLPIYIQILAYMLYQNVGM